LEDFIDELPRKIPRWPNPESPQGRAVLFHDGLVRSLLPITLRSSFLVAAWSLYEATVVEIADFLSSRLGRERLSIKPSVGFFRATERYYRDVLTFQRDAGPKITEELRVLYHLRNALAHGGGRKGAIRPAAWKQLSVLSANRGDFDVSRNFVEPSDELVYYMSHVVADAVNGLVKGARVVLARHIQTTNRART
jgi:hypothetical protein